MGKDWSREPFGKILQDIQLTDSDSSDKDGDSEEGDRQHRAEMRDREPGDKLYTEDKRARFPCAWLNGWLLHSLRWGNLEEELDMVEKNI